MRPRSWGGRGFFRRQGMLVAGSTASRQHHDGKGSCHHGVNGKLTGAGQETTAPSGTACTPAERPQD